MFKTSENYFTIFQIYPDGIRHIRSDKRVNEWKTPGKKNIVKCAVNQRQVVIALTGGELVYFEMDPVSLLLVYGSLEGIKFSSCTSYHKVKLFISWASLLSCTEPWQIL